MKVSDIVIYIMKIVWWGLKRILSSRVRDIRRSTKSQNSNKVTLRQVVRKQVSFQDRKKGNTPKFPCIEIKYIYVLFEFKHTEFFTSHRGYLLNTTLSGTHTQIRTPTKGGRGWMEPLPGVFDMLCTVFWSDFTFSGKPLIFLTRWSIFCGWWRCWRPMTSPTMVAILAAMLDFTEN